MQSSLAFAATTAYVSRSAATTAEMKSSSAWMDHLKNNRMITKIGGKVYDPPISSTEFLARVVMNDLKSGRATSTEWDGAVLLPVPRSSLAKAGDHWPALAIAQALTAAGIGVEISQALERRRAVPRSSMSRQEDRHRTTAAEHFESLGVSTLHAPGEKFVLVDDIVTSGSQLIGAASRVLASWPTVAVFGYAAIRTCKPDSWKETHEPVTGTIKLYPSGKCFRHP